MSPLKQNGQNVLKKACKALKLVRVRAGGGWSKLDTTPRVGANGTAVSAEGAEK